jgi:hypothetical protein
MSGSDLLLFVMFFPLPSTLKIMSAKFEFEFTQCLMLAIRRENIFYLPLSFIQLMILLFFFFWD